MKYFCKAKIRAPVEHTWAQKRRFLPIWKSFKFIHSIAKYFFAKSKLHRRLRRA